MKVRRLPAGLALGIPASLVGHGLLFGTDHEIGGPFHGAVLSVAFAALACFVILFATLAWQCGRAADGSIIAARLRQCLPRPESIFVWAALFFTVCESVESVHAAGNVLVMLAALALATWAVYGLAHVLVRAIADLTIAVTRGESAAREPQWCRRSTERPFLTRVSAICRHFARPPPATMASARA